MLSKYVKERRRKLAFPKVCKIEVGILEKAAFIHEAGEAKAPPTSAAGKIVAAVKAAISKPMTVGELAAIHEFGLGVPQRSFIRGYFDAKSADILSALNASWQARNPNDALLTALRITMAQTAVKARDGMKQYINERPFKANAKRTIKRKGSDLPLVDTGVLKSSISGRGVVQ